MPIFQKVYDPSYEIGEEFRVNITPAVEDSLGYLWIGSNEGLVKYSGSEIKKYKHIITDSTSLSGNDIDNLLLDKNHHLWVAIKGEGINVLDKNGKIEKRFAYDPENQSGLLDNEVWGMWQDADGFVWISYFAGGLSRYDKKDESFKHFTIDTPEHLEENRPKTVVKAVKDPNNESVYWLGTTSGLVRFDTRTAAFKCYFFQKKLREGEEQALEHTTVLRSLWTRDLIIDREGTLWISTFGGLIKFDR